VARVGVKETGDKDLGSANQGDREMRSSQAAITHSRVKSQDLHQLNQELLQQQIKAQFIADGVGR